MTDPILVPPGPRAGTIQILQCCIRLLIKASAFPEPVEVIIYDLAGALKFDPVAHTFTIIELLGIANLKGFYIPLSMAGPTGKFTVERVKGVIFREACRAFQSKMNACPFVPKVGLDLSQTTS